MKSVDAPPISHVGEILVWIHRMWGDITQAKGLNIACNQFLMALLTAGALALAIIYLLLAHTNKRTPRKGLREVPGPKPDSILGNVNQMGKYPQRSLQNWAREYGELFQLRLGWENWVYVNSPEAVKEIFDRQSQHTSSRAPSPVLSDLLSGGMRFLLMPYSPEWRRLRAIVHKLLTPKSSNAFKPSQVFEAKQLLWDILADNENQENFYMHIRRYTTSVVMTSTYGRRVSQWECEDIREIYGLMQEFSENAEPGKHLAELFPPLAKIPSWMQWWRPAALRSLQRQTSIWMKFWSQLKEQVEQKRAPECFVRHFMETDYRSQGISEVQAGFVAGTMIEAGSETTSSALNSCVKYLAAYPEAQAKACDEVRRVISESRMPSFEDEDSLPYIRACVKEVLRIRPVTNIGSPHYTTSDIIYKDYLIPANTVVSINQYALHFDPNRYEQPDAFIPDRYLNHPLKAGAYAAHPDPYVRDHFDFGAGRRICPGLHLAENSLFITIAMIIWAFEILPPVLEDGTVGKVDVSDEAYEQGVNTLPLPSQLRFIPRSEKVKRTIRGEWTTAQREGYFLGGVNVDGQGVVVP